MGQVHSAANVVPDVVESSSYAQEEVLERAITKLAMLGREVGVSADDMISLLESGLSVLELVEYLAAKNGRCRCEGRGRTGF